MTLQDLSKAATQGKWHNCHVQGWGYPDSTSMIAARDHNAKTIAGDCPIAIFKDGASHWDNKHPFNENAAFVTALVNAYRQGALVEAGNVREEIEKARDWHQEQAERMAEYGNKAYEQGKADLAATLLRILFPAPATEQSEQEDTQ